MSVVVDALTKRYGTQNALDAISFEAKAGEILGFLGPNGAGKTTTMKIICGYLTPTSGQASVMGMDVEQESLAVRREIGYLPEHNPLYPDMYVREYLRFVARVHKLSDASARIAELVEQTGLEREQHKPIRALSKGYRQRVGLAQALLHDPSVLILDEPTSGLDPNQLVEIRQLIKSISTEKTVLFSTHIMQEVQALCDRVVIINRGKIVADDPIDQLQRRLKGQAAVTVEFAQAPAGIALEKITGVSAVEALGANRFRILSPADQDLRERVFRFAVDQKLTLLELQRESVSVEDVFRYVTSELESVES